MIEAARRHCTRRIGRPRPRIWAIAADLSPRATHNHLGALRGVIQLGQRGAAAPVTGSSFRRNRVESAGWLLVAVA